MIEKAIENWLTNTKERNYLPAFCQSLLHKGHKIVYVSSHRPLEQGKDIITIDPNADYCAFQLKTGDVNLAEWRKIQGEINELISLPIVHPSIDKNKGHKAFLVTNGAITDEVRLQITQINDDNIRKGRQYAYLTTIEKPEILKDLIDAQGKVFPKSLIDVQTFLSLYLSNGYDFLAKERYVDFINGSILSSLSSSRTDKIDAISSSIIIASYLLYPFQLRNNYYALFEAWTLLAAMILRFALSADLDQKYWHPSYSLVFSEIINSLALLKKEVMGRTDFLEGDIRGDGLLVYRARATIVLGTIAACENYFSSADSKYATPEDLLKIFENNLSILWFWGESAFPFFFNIMALLEKNNILDRVNNPMLENVVTGLIEQNQPRGKDGMANPYYSINDILNSAWHVSPQESENIDFSQFSGSSYTLEPLIYMVVRRGNRNLVDLVWKSLSYIQYKEFKPKIVEDFFLWRANEGTNTSCFPKQTQSWAELLKGAKDINIPKLYMEHIDIIRLFTLVVPHRFNNQIAFLLDR
jgi:hypothetical protein